MNCNSEGQGRMVAFLWVVMGIVATALSIGIGREIVQVWSGAVR